MGIAAPAESEYTFAFGIRELGCLNPEKVKSI